jgi:hypothetical protein
MQHPFTSIKKGMLLTSKWSQATGTVAGQIHLLELRQRIFAIFESTLVCRGRRRWIAAGTDHHFRTIRRNAVTKNIPKEVVAC